MSNLVSEECWSCGDLAVSCGFNKVACFHRFYDGSSRRSKPYNFHLWVPIESCNKAVVETGVNGTKN